MYLIIMLDYYIGVYLYLYYSYYGDFKKSFIFYFLKVLKVLLL